MAIEKLTQAFIKTEMKKPGRRLIGDGAGLWLHKGAEPGVASWVFRYERESRMRSVGLGPLHTIDLDRARQKARELRNALQEGRNPADERATHKRTASARAAKAAAHGKTFEQLAREHIERNAAAWKERAAKEALAQGKEAPKKGSAHQWLQSLEAYAFPHLGRLRADEIQVEDVMRVLEQPTTARDGTKGSLWTTKNETAARVRGRVEAVLDGAMARGAAIKRPNPAAWDANLAHLLPARGKVHQSTPMAALDWRDVPTFMPRLREKQGDGARALEASMLSAARSNEIRGLKWTDLQDLDGDNPAWLLKGEAMKAGEAHAVPLVPQVVALIKAQPVREGCAYVFAHQQKAGAPWRPLSENAMLAVLDELRVQATQHGMRASLRTWCLEATSFKRELAELTLAHATGSSESERSYLRGSAFDQRRELLEAWARHCDGLAPTDAHVRPAKKRGAALKVVG